MKTLTLVLLSTLTTAAFGLVLAPPKKITANGNYLLLQPLTDESIHFEFGRGEGPKDLEVIASSPMILKTDYSGPKKMDFDKEAGLLSLPSMRVRVNLKNACFEVEDKVRGRVLTTLCPDDLTQEWKKLTIEPRDIKHIYGIGQDFKDRGAATADGDWLGEKYIPGEQGNGMKWVHGGGPSQAQFPVMYALGDNGENYALFFDVAHKIEWDFSVSWWKVGTLANPIRGYIFTGANLPALQKQYMDLTGYPPVPPKQVLGLWTSEFGYTSWNEIDGALDSLRRNKFPADGFFLDIQWFGLWFNVPEEKSRMGSLSFDPEFFPDADAKLKELGKKGIRLGLIQEPYLSDALPEHKQMEEKGYLARENKDKLNASRIVHNPWWGKGGIIDFTNPAAGNFWFDLKIKPLLEKGMLVNWTDLTEPEMYNSWAWYHGDKQHRDVHNIYALSMASSIHRGYDRNKIVWQRPYIMSRSGTSGIHRYGVGMWSGDVGSNMKSMATHYNSRLHMAFNGIYYYSSDIGGFHPSFDGDGGALFTQWFANSAMLDIPVRPHSWVYEKRGKKPDGHRVTAPDRVGHLESNRQNLRLRYQLAPYYYSLAHIAHRTGAPIMPPLVFEYQNDRNVRKMGNEVLIGTSLLTGIVAGYGQTTRAIYFPKGSGRWFDFHSNQAYDLEGTHFADFPLYRDGKLRLPLFAKAGAIIPMSKVDDQTLNMLGMRADGSRIDDLIVRVYADEKPSKFTLYEDDGVSAGYRKGEVRTTDLSQKREGNRVVVTLAAAAGSFPNAPAERPNQIEIVVDQKQAKSARLKVGDGEFREIAVTKLGSNIFSVRTDKLPVDKAKVIEVELEDAPLKTSSAYFVCQKGDTKFGESVYVSGNIPELGEWNPAKAIRLDAIPNPTWTKLVENLPPKTKIEWKCLKSTLANQWVWEGGANHVLTAQSAGYYGKAEGSF